MVRFPLSTVPKIHPPKFFNCNSNFIAQSSLKQIFQIHAQIIISGLSHNSYITDKIIQFCASDSGRAKHLTELINHGYNVVDLSQKLESFSWNTVIRAYATSNLDFKKEALWVYLDMRRLGVRPDEHTFPFIFKSCASFVGLNEGRQIHGDAVKHGCDSNVYVGNTLIHLYGTCKKLMDAYKVFDEMLHRTVVSWNSIISANVECCWFYDAVELFVRMRNSGIDPDQTTLVIVLSACAEIGNLSMGKWVHSQVIQKDMFVNCQLGTALVDMYGKCGDVKYASLVFNRIVYRNVWTWSSMILGFAQHGFARDALEMFREMRNYSIKPNHVTFLGVLCACSHTGLVEDGQCYFNEMERVHGIKPTMVHYGAMVDILGRAGRIKEAYDFVVNMPIEADGIVWRALLSACKIHDVNDLSGVEDKVRRRLIELEPKNSRNFVMLANNYAEVGLWVKAANLRSKMKKRGLKKIAGESCVEIAGTSFRFLCGDNSCVGFENMVLLLRTIDLHTKMIKFE